MDECSYIRVRWMHAFPDEPTDLWRQLDADRREVRKVEIWSDGRVGYAPNSQGSERTRLGKLSVPPTDEINSDPQFHAKAITRADFEMCWLDAIDGVARSGVF